MKRVYHQVPARSKHEGILASLEGRTHKAVHYAADRVFLAVYHGRPQKEIDGYLAHLKFLTERSVTDALVPVESLDQPGAVERMVNEVNVS